MSKRTSWESLRPWPVYLAAAMLPISLAATNLFKLMMVIFAVVTLGIGLAWRERQPGFSQLRTPTIERCGGVGQAEGERRQHQAHFRDRVNAVVTESVAYSNGDRTPTSSGIRLGLWHRSLQAIGERPLSGHGAGSWTHVYRRLEGRGPSPLFASLRNPHQEYLMWGVQLGLGGIALLLALQLALLRDASRFSPDIRHAAYSMVAIFAVVCLFNSTLFDALIGDYFCLLLGLLLALGLHTPAQEIAS